MSKPVKPVRLAKFFFFKEEEEETSCQDNPTLFGVCHCKVPHWIFWIQIQKPTERTDVDQYN
jgi:hypothetical protein